MRAGSMNYTTDWNLATIPLPQLKSEWARRNALKAQHPIKKDPTTAEARKWQREYRRKRRAVGLDK